MIEFTTNQVKALCGGRFPGANGFDWNRVERFELEDGALEPYAGDQILPGPGLRFESVVEDWGPEGVRILRIRHAKS